MADVLARLRLAGRDWPPLTSALLGEAVSVEVIFTSVDGSAIEAGSVTAVAYRPALAGEDAGTTPAIALTRMSVGVWSGALQLDRVGDWAIDARCATPSIAVARGDLRVTLGGPEALEDSRGAASAGHSASLALQQANRAAAAAVESEAARAAAQELVTPNVTCDDQRVAVDMTVTPASFYRITVPPGAPRIGIDVPADLVVYGASSAGCAAAIQMARSGGTVIIVGAWRERHLGGLMSGGLGGSDVHNVDAYGGLPRAVVARIAALNGKAPNATRFEPRFAEQAFQQFLTRFSIPVYWSDGLQSVTKVGTRITSITTFDGATYLGRCFVECSYEGDLLRLSGADYTVGREAADADNPMNGWRGTSSLYKGDVHNWTGSGAFGDTLKNVSPFVTPGVPESGLLPGLEADPGLAVGAADQRMQAYNFRMIMTTIPDRRVNAFRSPPPGFNPLNYELMLRWLGNIKAAGLVHGVDYSWPGNFVIPNTLVSQVWDVNFRGPFSTDFVGQSWTYPLASNAEREVIRQAHINYIKGLFHVWQYYNDPRVPDDFRAYVLDWGLDAYHFTTPWNGDEAFWPYQLYVRESIRMVGDYVHQASDVTAADGTIPRSLKTVATGSYDIDSHATTRIPAFIGGQWQCWNEGNVQVFDTGDEIFPIPYEALLPKVSQVTNMMSLTCPSATHPAFGAMRMEFTFLAMGQAAGAAARLWTQGDMAEPLQSLSYSALRAELLASPDPTPPVLPQVN